jgi:ketosteroid isomerase-like protein
LIAGFTLFILPPKYTHMKHVFAILAVALFFSLSFTANAQKKSKGATQTSMQDNSNLPYTAMYSSNFQMGNSKYSRMVLDAWKAYDDNAFDRITDMIADTVTAIMPDGSMIKGKEAFLSAIKSYRGGFATAASTVDAWVPIKSTDKGDDIVCIWGSETDTKSDGTSQKVDLHELWAFNKDGKLFFFRQFAGPAPKEGQ